jgi:hypothetical protein
VSVCDRTYYEADGWRFRLGDSADIHVAERDHGRTRMFAASDEELLRLLHWRENQRKRRRARHEEDE